jgi:hypothetical protein
MGRGLALLEAKLAIAQLFRNFEFDLVPNQQIIPVVSVNTQTHLWHLLFCV